MESEDLVEVVLEAPTVKKVRADKPKGEHTTGIKIKSFFKKIRVPLILILLVAVGVLLFLNYRKKQQQAASMKAAVQIETVDVEKRNLTTSITTTGTVESMESRMIQSALNKTELSEVNVEVGDTVSAGQIVAIFKDEDIKTEIARVQDKINVSAQTEAIDSQSTDREYVYTYGTQALSLEEAQRKVDDALRDLYDACDGYGKAKRSLQAAKDEGKTQTEIEKLETSVSTAYQNEVKAQTAYDDALRAQTETIRSANNTLASTDESYQKTALTKGDSTEELKQQLEDLQTSLSDCIVTAPINGIITSLPLKSGDTYVDGEIMTIQNCENYTISAQVDEYDISDLEEGMKVVIKTDATRDDELEGVVSFISPTATAAGTSSDATYEVTIDILTKDERLKLGMTAKLNIIVDEVKDVLTVPYDAISTNAEGESYVSVLSNHNQSQTVEQDVESKQSQMQTQPQAQTPKQDIVVEIGMESDYYTQIISDELTEGMKVIIPSATGTQGTDTKSDSMMFNMGGGMGGMGGAPGGGRPQ